MVAVIKIRQWRPDTHPGHILEIEWEYDQKAGRDTGREHRGISVRYPDGIHVHRETHGADVAHQHYKKVLAEHVIKNKAQAIIAETLPVHMKRPMLDAEGNTVLDEGNRPHLVPKEKHALSFTHLGSGKYEFSVHGIDETTRLKIAAKLAEFGERVVVLKSA